MHLTAVGNFSRTVSNFQAHCLLPRQKVKNRDPPRNLARILGSLPSLGLLLLAILRRGSRLSYSQSDLTLSSQSWPRGVSNGIARAGTNLFPRSARTPKVSSKVGLTSC
jgi:hypothetical protein